MGGAFPELTPPPGEVFVGKDLGGHDYEITAELVRRYEEGTGDRNGIYCEIAPGLLFHSECYTFLQDWYLPELVGNLHAKQEFELFGVARVGERVWTRAFVSERYRKRNRNYVVCEVHVLSEAGALLNRGRTHQSFLAEDPDAVVVDREREKRGDRRFDVGGGSGRRVAGREQEVTLEMCQAFSGPGKNYHTDREAARQLGFPDVVVQGMMSLCFLSGLLTAEYGEGWLRGGKVNVNLVNVVWAGDRVTPAAELRDEQPEGALVRDHLDVWCEKPDGTKVVVGTASALTGLSPFSSRER